MVFLYEFLLFIRQTDIPRRACGERKVVHGTAHIVDIPAGIERALPQAAQFPVSVQDRAAAVDGYIARRKRIRSRKDGSHVFAEIGRRGYLNNDILEQPAAEKSDPDAVNDVFRTQIEICPADGIARRTIRIVFFPAAVSVGHNVFPQLVDIAQRCIVDGRRVVIHRKVFRHIKAFKNHFLPERNVVALGCSRSTVIGKSKPRSPDGYRHT